MINKVIMSKKPNGYWNNKEKVFAEARKYNTKTEFQKGCRSAYHNACKNKWLPEMTWFVRPIVHNKKWTKEKVFEEARKYNTKTEFQKGCCTAYDVALRNKWLTEMTWFVDGRIKLFTDKNNCIYTYYWKETNVIYVGRTNRSKDRDNEHLFDKRDSVFKYAKENDFVVPPMEIIEDSLTLEESVEREGYWVKYYRERGYNVLNKAKTGAIGSIGKGKWPRERVFEEARKYQTKKEFNECCNGAYQKACKKGWIYEMTWFASGRKPRKWTREALFEEARKYKTKSEFEKNASGAYCAAIEKGLLSEMDWFKETRRPSGYWYIKENVFAEARKYKTKKEFEKGCGRAYNIARQRKWLNEMDWFVRIIKWTKDNVFAEARKYKTKKEFEKGCRGAYGAALNKGWLSEMDWFVRPISPNKKWTKESVFEEGKKYKTRKEFQRGSGGAYQTASKNRWLPEMDWFKETCRPSGYWHIKENTFAEAKKYQRKIDFQRGCSGAYKTARKNKWLDELFPKNSSN